MFDQYRLHTPENRTAAVVFYEQACRGGWAESCTNLGVHAKHGDGMQRDLARAQELFEQGCQGGNALGCEHLARGKKK